jgi:hypothetical protein
MKRTGYLELTWQGLPARLTQARRGDSTSLLFFEGTPNHKTHNTQDAITGSFNPALTVVPRASGLTAETWDVGTPFNDTLGRGPHGPWGPTDWIREDERRQ